MEYCAEKTHKTSSKLPEDQLSVVNCFLRFIRKHSGIPTGSPYPPSHILNLDETPIPWEYLDGYTYDNKAVHTVAGKALQHGWAKRQATLILYTFADGVKRIKPKLIFHSTVNGKLKDTQDFMYDKSVTVEFNEKAYNNEDMLNKWLEEEYKLLREQGGSYLVVLDQASFHRTAEILAWLKANFTIPVVVPPGCTSLVQPLNTAVNCSLECLLKEETEYTTELEEEDMIAESISVEDWSPWRRRRLVTRAVARAWDRLKSDLIV
jgi:hypothetical protein